MLPPTGRCPCEPNRRAPSFRTGSVYVREQQQLSMAMPRRQLRLACSQRRSRGRAARLGADRRRPNPSGLGYSYARPRPGPQGERAGRPRAPAPPPGRPAPAAAPSSLSRQARKATLARACARTAASTPRKCPCIKKPHTAVLVEGRGRCGSGRFFPWAGTVFARRFQRSASAESAFRRLSRRR